LAPFTGGYKYVLDCAVGSTAMMVIKKNIMKMSFSKSYSEKVILGTDTLIQKAIVEGKEEERAPGIHYFYL
jgi:hypothetical protein